MNAGGRSQRKARGTRVTVAIRAGEWDIGEDDFGGVMIFHRHAGYAAPAYVIDEVGAWRVAECSECSEKLDFAMPSAPTSRWDTFIAST